MTVKAFTLLVTAALLLSVPGTVLGKESGCAECHGDKDMAESARVPAEMFTGDAHDKAGLTCADCHGGDPDTTDFLKAHGKADGFRSRPKEKEIVSLCSGCHGSEERMKAFGVEEPDVSQVAKFHSSVHGQIDPVEGFEIPTCASCHGPHGIRPPEDPLSSVHPTKVPELCSRCHTDLAYMRAFTSARVRVDQMIEYKTSVHGMRIAEGDTKVAVCSSCHGSHDILRASNPNSRVHPLNVAATCGQCHSDAAYMKGYFVERLRGQRVPMPTNQQASYERSVHHAALTEKGDLSAPTCNDCHGNHGATPPQVRVVAHVCAECHSRPAELYEGSELRAEFDKSGHPHCATCHGNHEIVRPGTSLLADLAKGATPTGWRPEEKWRKMTAGFQSSITDLSRRLDEAEALVARVENYGMDLTRARLKLNQAQDGLVRSRVSVHAFDPARLAELTEGTEDEVGSLALIAQATTLAEEALAERSYRRYGLGVALVIIAFLMTMLILKIRQMEAGGG